MESQSPLSREQIDAVLEFLPVFEAEGFEFGKWGTEGQSRLWYSWSAETKRFIKSLYLNHCILEFDWPKWQETAARFVIDPDALRRANLDELRRLLTTHVRKDRFCQNHLAMVLENGHITAILHRLKEIRRAMD